MYIILNVRSQTVAINNCIILLNLNFYTKIFNKKIVFIFFSDRSNLHNSFFFLNHGGGRESDYALLPPKLYTLPTAL